MGRRRVDAWRASRDIARVDEQILVLNQSLEIARPGIRGEQQGRAPHAAFERCVENEPPRIW